MRVLVFSLLLFTLIGCAPSVKETKPTTVSPAVRIRVYSGGVEQVEQRPRRVGIRGQPPQYRSEERGPGEGEQ